MLEATTAAPALRLRLNQSAIMAAAMIRRSRTTPTNKPTVFPVWERTPPPPPDFSGCVVGAGGSVGVIVSVLTWPVTVITDVIGVADHVDVSDGVSDDELVEEAEVEVVEIVGVGDIIRMMGGAGFEDCNAGVVGEDVGCTGDGVVVELVEGV